MATVNVRRREEAQIFAHRNSRIKRYPHMSRNSSSADKHPPTNKQASKLMIFKDRLAAYIQAERTREDNSVGSFVFWNKPRAARQGKKTSAQQEPPSEGINQGRKESILQNLRRSCNQALLRQRYPGQQHSEGQLNFQRGIIHANTSEVRRKSHTESPSYNEFSGC